MIGRGAFAIFVGIVVLAFAQVAWWMLFLVRVGGERRHLVMFASEGAFFMLALITGLMLMWRTLAEQVRLRSARATFLSAVTHELKSPLAAIRLFLETLERGRVDEEKRKDLVKKMLIDTGRLEGLVADLLRAGQIEAHALQPDLRPLRLEEVGREVVERVRPRLTEGDSLELHASREVETWGDPALLARAIENLLDNAFKYSRPPRRITVRVGVEGGTRACVEVEDEGAGVDPAFAARAFEPFQRAGDEETRAATGTGLGLFIVRGIAEAHGGDAWLRSRAPRAGTVAGFAFPLDRHGATRMASAAGGML